MKTKKLFFSGCFGVMLGCLTGPALAQSTQPSALDKDGALAATTLSGKLWIVAVNTSASFPPPNPKPDATFTTNHAVFIGDGPDPTNTKLGIHSTIGSFLASSHPVSNLVFSGLVNPVLGRAATASTLLRTAFRTAALLAPTRLSSSSAAASAW
jgi:hypothetical protein